MAFNIRNIDAGNVSIDDLGITLIPGETYDLTQEQSFNVSSSVDLPAAITGGIIVVLDPLDNVTVLSTADGNESVAAFNDTHYRIRGGRALDVSFDNSGIDNVGTDLQAAVVDNSGKVEWRNQWAQQTYEKHDMVVDSGWTMIANAQTTDRPAPQTEGAAIVTPPDTTTWTTDTFTGVVRMVHKYTVLESGWGTQLRIRTAFWDTNVITRITIFYPDNNTTTVYDDPTLTDDGWTTLNMADGFALAGTNVEVWYEYYNGDDAGRLDGGWISVLGSFVPSFQRFTIDSFSNPTQIRFHETDLDSNNRTTELDAVTIGSIINIVETGDTSRAVEAEVTAVDTSASTSTQYTVVLIQNGQQDIRANQTCTIRIDIPIVLPAVYNVNVDYWVSNQPTWATISSELYYDGVLQADVNDAYGIEVTFQKASISLDWDLVSSDTSGGGGGAGGGGGEANTASNLGAGTGVFAQKNGTDLEFKSLTAGTAIQLTPSGAEIQITNLAPNITQNLWAIIVGDTGNTTADTPTDTLTIVGTGTASTSIAADTLTIDVPKKTHLSRHNGLVVQTIAQGVDVVVLFGINRRTDPTYTHNVVNGGSEITINVAGWYAITFDLTVDDASNARTSSRALLELNGNLVDGSIAYGYHRNTSNGETTASVTLKEVLAVNDVVRVVARGEDGDVQTVADGCRLNIESIDSP